VWEFARGWWNLFLWCGRKRDVGAMDSRGDEARHPRVGVGSMLISRSVRLVVDGRMWRRMLCGGGCRKHGSHVVAVHDGLPRCGSGGLSQIVYMWATRLLWWLGGCRRRYYSRGVAVRGELPHCGCDDSSKILCGRRSIRRSKYILRGYVGHYVVTYGLPIVWI